MLNDLSDDTSIPVLSQEIKDRAIKHVSAVAKSPEDELELLYCLGLVEDPLSVTVLERNKKLAAKPRTLSEKMHDVVPYPPRTRCKNGHRLSPDGEGTWRWVSHKTAENGGNWACAKCRSEAEMRRRQKRLRDTNRSGLF